MRHAAVLQLLTGAAGITAASNSSSRSAAGAGRGTCIFDFDGTLKMPDNTAAKGAQQVVSACSGYNIALASAGGSDDYKRKWLAAHFPEEFKSVVNTPAFQSSQPDKYVSIEAILDYYSASPSCAVLFDDSSGNKKYADKAGIHFEQVNTGTGITMSDFYDASGALSNCVPAPAPGPRPGPPPSGCTDVGPDSNSCADQKSWGKCGKSFMKGYCCMTCFNCAASCTGHAPPPVPGPPPAPTPSKCTDVGPDSHSCGDQKSWGKCGESWMTGYCCKTCFNCKAGCGK